MPASEFRLRRWILVSASAEAFGFLVPIAVFAGLSMLRAPGWGIAIAVPLAGAAEGALLGFGQALATRANRIPLPGGPWIAATAVGAVMSWSFGMLPSTLIDAFPSLVAGPGWIGITLAAALAVLLALPIAQWVVLRRHLPRAWRWIPWSVLAWLLGLPWTFIAGLFFDQNTPPAQVMATFAVAGVLMALTVATVTGMALRRILASTENRSGN